MTFRSLTAAAVLWAFSALAASSVDALRVNATSARNQVVQLRAEQLTNRAELSTLSARIEALKGKQQSVLLPGSELDAALKRSQELSGVLSSLARRMALSENELVSANMALLDSLSADLLQARIDFDRQTDREARRAVIARMKQLRLERESVRAALPASRVPSVESLNASPSDDPEELLEQAELMRDNEERLMKELKSVDARLAERREEQELDRRMQRFFSEESMFDDQDRRMRMQRTTANSLETRGTTSFAASGPETVPVTGASSAANDTAVPRGVLDDSAIRVTNASDARPQLGSSPLITGREPDDVAALSAQRASLQKLVDGLRAKAAALENRATQLK